MKFALRSTKDSWYGNSEEREQLEEIGFSFSGGSPAIVNEIPIDLASLEELIDLQARCKHPLIIDGDTIEIYNVYRE